MCLAIPGKIIEIDSQNPQHAVVDVVGVRRKVDLGLLQDDPPVPGDWVLIHVGFAMSKISEAGRARSDADARPCSARARPRCRKCAATARKMTRRIRERPRADAMKFVDEFRDPELITQGGAKKSAGWPIPTATTASWKCAAGTRTPSIASA